MSRTPLEIFTRASDAIFKFEMHFNKMREEDHHVYTIEVMTDELKSLWSDAKAAYNDCVDDLASSSKAKPELLEAAEGKYQSTLAAYARCVRTMRVKSDELASKSEEKSSRVGKDEMLNGNTCHSLPLPPCEIEIFNGDYMSWPTFRDLFTALYVNNNRICNVERLYYLLKRTRKDAKEIVSKCLLTNAELDIAWAKLKETYEKTRMLVNNQFKCLLSLESVNRETSVGLRNLQCGINGFLSAMSIYEISTENCEPFIVFICIQRLPSQQLNCGSRVLRIRQRCLIGEIWICFYQNEFKP